MMDKGIDNGYLYTKSVSSLGKSIFKSAYTMADKAVNGMATINIDGREYCVGVGKSTTDTDKTDSEMNKICTLTDLAMSGEGEYNLVVNLPIGQYNAQKEKFKKMIFSYNNCKVFYHNKPFNFKICNVIVVPQGVAALYSTSQKEGCYIVFDIGGLTIDVGLIESSWGTPTPQKTDTWYKGIVTLYPKIIEIINNKYGLTLEPSFAEYILTNGLYLLGEKQDTSFLQPLMNAYLDDMFADFKNTYPCKNVPIFLCGGGASIMYPYFRQHFPQAQLIEDSQFANAIGCYYIGVQTFNRTQQVAVGGKCYGK